MGKKVFIAIVVIAAASAYLTVREQGADEAFGGVFAPVESARSDDVDSLGLITGNSIPDTAQTDYKQMVDRVRDRTNAAMAKSVERSSR